MTGSFIARCAQVGVALLSTAMPLVGNAQSSDVLRIDRTSVEYQEHPLGIDTVIPRFSWKIRPAGQRGILQVAYEIRVARSEADLTKPKLLLWASGKVPSGESTLRSYQGPALLSRHRYFWQVRIWDSRGHRSDWSIPGWWEMGLLEPGDWQAQWVRSADQTDPKETGTPPELRRAFTLREQIKRARVYVTAHGLYELQLNGARVGRDLLTPGWTSYRKRLQYQTYDVTDQVHPGSNAVGAILGNGWYRGILGFSGNRRNHYGSEVALLMQLEVEYQDGTRDTVSTDGNWTASTGPLRMAEIYDGETYDARLETPGWSTSSFDSSGWMPVLASPLNHDPLIASDGPPVRAYEEITPRRIFRTPNGEWVADMGQNMVGWVRLRVNGPRGTTVVLRHGEVLDSDGNFYVENLRTAKQEIRYMLKGEGEEVYEPRFTFQGFRYVSIEGYPGELNSHSLVGVVIHSDLGPFSTFETSDASLNQLFHNILWGQRGNFVDIPTDCPQRDERLGWTGDAQVFSPTAAFNANVAPFFAKWLQDLAADQFADGAVPWVAPDVLSTPKSRNAGAAGWGDAAVVIPWVIYLSSGDRRILETQYPSMAAWVEFQRSRAGPDLIWKRDFTFGDWLDFGSDTKRPVTGKTPTSLISTAYFAHSADLLSRTAHVLGRTDDEKRYRDVFESVRNAFQKSFVSTDGRVGPGTQTAQVLAMRFDLLTSNQRQEAAAFLAKSVRETGHLTTGFLGTPELLFALSDDGQIDLAYQLLTRKDYPSWLYPISKGATTIWERWDGIRPDGTLQPKDMNSFNHYAYGAVGDWMYRVVAGLSIDPEHPGYRHVLIAPHPGGGLSSARAVHESPYGPIAVSWKRREGSMEVEATLPPNTSGTIRLPLAHLNSLIESGRRIGEVSGISGAHQEDGYVELKIGSGDYRFGYPVAVAQ